MGKETDVGLYSSGWKVLAKKSISQCSRNVLGFAGPTGRKRLAEIAQEAMIATLLLLQNG